MPAENFARIDPATGLVTGLKNAREMMEEEVANVDAGRYYIPSTPTYRVETTSRGHYEPAVERPAPLFEPPPLRPPAF